MPDFAALIDNVLPELIALRHDLHRHPELGYQEHWTADRVAAELAKVPGLAIRRGVAETGIVATLHADRPGRCVALRADLDALPLTEANTFDHASQHAGCMHACGHDGHMACLLGAARVLGRVAADAPDALPGCVKFIFQPAEEGGGGGKRMIDGGALDDPPVAAAFALHGWPDVDRGTVLVGEGAIFAATTLLEITLTGTGTHAAYPHHGDDLVVAAAQLINALQTVAARLNDPVEPVLLSVTAVRTGEAYNVLPDRVELRGTIRTASAERMQLAKQQVERITAGHASASGIEATVRTFGDYPPVVNDPAAAEVVAAVAAEAGPAAGVTGVVADPPLTLAGEDFAYFGQRVPAVLWRLGLRPPGAANYPQLHHPRFDFPDEVIKTAVELHCRIAQRFLSDAAQRRDRKGA